MKDRLARALAIVALIFMVLFVASLTTALINPKLLDGAFIYSTIALGVFVLMIFMALKADGRGFSITKMNNEAQMKKLREEQAKLDVEKTENVTVENANADKPTDEKTEVENAEAVAEAKSETAAENGVAQVPAPKKSDNNGEKGKDAQKK